MSLTSWLEPLRARCAGFAASAIRRDRTGRTRKTESVAPLVQQVEPLETRCLLSVSALLINGTLNVTASAADDVTVRANSTTGRVEVLGNNNVLVGSTPAVNASTLTYLVITGSDSDNVVDLSGVTSAQFTALTSIVVSGGDGSDRITGSPDLANSLNGGDGADTLIGGSSGNVLNGGNGADAILGGVGADSLLGGDGADTITGDDGNDTIFGGNGADSVDAGNGADSVEGNNGEDSLVGGLGDDTINGDGGTDTISGGDGNDVILGGEFNDSLLGGAGDDTIDAQAGNDTVLGEAGDDSLVGGLGFDSLAGGAGQDFLNGGADDDTLVGGADLDTLFGGAGNDSLFGDEVTATASSVGNDVLNGQSGNDTLDGGGGNDQLDGGTGNDLLQPNVVDLSASGLSLSIDDPLSVTEGNAGIVNVSVTVRLSQSSVEPVMVDYTTADDTALVGVDYLAVSGTLVFAAGQITRTITVPVRGDVSFEGSETLFVNLSNSVGAFINDAQAVVTILNDDPQAGLPRITIDDVIVDPELDGPFSFTFAAPVRYPVGRNPIQPEAVDVDRDGDLDLVVANLQDEFIGSTSTSFVSVIRNNGNGTFGTTQTYVLNGTQFHEAMTVDDLNGDAFPDIVVTSRGTQIDVLLNNGDGTFGASRTVAVGNTPSGVDAADINGDGDLDLAVANRIGDTVTILDNDGNANFTTIGTLVFPAPDTPSRNNLLQFSDLNRDGRQDIVVTANSAGVFVYLSTGPGTFGPPATFGAGGLRDGFLDLGDLNGDGFIDLVTTPTEPNDTQISVFRGNGDGTFAAPLSVNVIGSCLGVRLADIDGDGDRDVIVAATGSNGVRILLNDGAGTLSAPLFFGGMNSATNVAAGDFDSDSDLDLAVTQGSDAMVAVLANLRDPPVFATGVVRLSAPSLTAVTLTLTTANGSALAGSDYQQTTIPVTIPVGSQSAPFSIPILSDVSDEPNENFFVNLSNVSANATIADSQGQVTIADDDGGVIAASTLTISDVTLAEGNAGTTNFVFNVTLTRPAGNNSVVTVQYRTADDAATSGGAQPDYTASGPITLTFAAGVTTQQITIPVNRDVFIEPDEAFFVNLLNPVGAILTDSRAVGLIQDDDGGTPTPLVLVNDVLIDEGNSGSVLAVVTLTLSSPAPAAVSITLSTADGSARAGSDYSATTTTINIPIGGTSGTASIPILGDTRDELAEFFTVNLSGVSGGLLTATSLQITIRDDDGPTFSSPNDVLLSGGDGNDTLNAGLGNDTLNGGAGNDSLSGGSGNDNIFGGAGVDTLNGGDGDDTLDGQGGSDIVDGGAGDDQLVWNGAGDGKDTLSSTAGADAVVVNGTGASNVFTVGKNVAGQLTVAESGITLVVSSSITYVTINGNNGDDTITVGSLTGVVGTVLTINGGVGDDVISAVGVSVGDVRMLLSGGVGNDSLTGSSSHDTLDGGDGSDTLLGGLGNDSIFGGAGVDRINGEAGDDSLDGGADNDGLNGGDGNDVITGGTGDDSLRGGNGNDTVSGDVGADTINGEAGNDSLDGGTGTDTLSGGDGADTITGGAESDSITGEAGNDSIFGNDGNDTIDSGEGNDTVIAGDGGDVVSGGLGDDAINGGDGNDTLNGGAGRDVLVGGDGNDVLLGGADIDTLLAGDGDDTLNGQGSTDVLAGNEGNDVFNDATAVIDEQFVLSSTLMTALGL